MPFVSYCAKLHSCSAFISIHPSICMYLSVSCCAAPFSLHQRLLIDLKNCTWLYHLSNQNTWIIRMSTVHESLPNVQTYIELVSLDDLGGRVVRIIVSLIVLVPFEALRTQSKQHHNYYTWGNIHGRVHNNIQTPDQF